MPCPRGDNPSGAYAHEVRLLTPVACAYGAGAGPVPIAGRALGIGAGRPAGAVPRRRNSTITAIAAAATATTGTPASPPSPTTRSAASRPAAHSNAPSR